MMMVILTVGYRLFIIIENGKFSFRNMALKIENKRGFDPPILTKSNNSLIPVCFLSLLRSTRNATTETHSLHFQTSRPTAPVSCRPLATIGKGRSLRPRELQESACFWLRCSLQKGLPFEVRIPNAATLAAINELESGKGGRLRLCRSLRVTNRITILPAALRYSNPTSNTQPATNN
jgi:hypothetical protein